MMNEKNGQIDMPSHLFYLAVCNVVESPLLKVHGREVKLKELF